jgi:hypothetical protein
MQGCRQQGPVLCHVWGGVFAWAAAQLILVWEFCGVQMLHAAWLRFRAAWFGVQFGFDSGLVVCLLSCGVTFASLS